MAHVRMGRGHEAEGRARVDAHMQDEQCTGRTWYAFGYCSSCHTVGGNRDGRREHVAYYLIDLFSH
jgi:hypothetical protein